MSTKPESHIRNSHELVADGKVSLFELIPADGSGTLYFKNDNEHFWQGHMYESMPVKVSGEKQSSDSGLTMPKMQIGQTDVDISKFKGLIFDGNLDNAIITRKTLLLDHLIKNINIAEVQTYRVKRIENYSRSFVNLQLATLSDSLGFSLPHRAYNRPDFAAVQM